MKKIILVSLFIVVILFTANKGFSMTPASIPDVYSLTFKDNKTLPDKMVYNGFGCEGGNLSPHLNWHGLKPEGTKSYAITIHDPDAPTTSGWWHWLVYNIPADVNHIEEGASKTANNKMPEGSLEAFTDYGTTGFGGACPPKGDIPHKYNITIYALKVEKLKLDPKTTTGAKLTYMLNANSLGKVTLTGTYGR